MQVCDNHVCDKAQDDESEDDADLEPLAVWEDHFEHRHLQRVEIRGGLDVERDLMRFVRLVMEWAVNLKLLCRGDMQALHLHRAAVPFGCPVRVSRVQGCRRFVRLPSQGWDAYVCSDNCAFCI
jgi:hypothetical protein